MKHSKVNLATAVIEAERNRLAAIREHANAALLTNLAKALGWTRAQA